MKFKINDRVKCIDTDCGALCAGIGDIGKIIYIECKSSLPYLVEFDNKRSSYHSGGRGKNNHCYWCSDKMLERIKRKPIVIYQEDNKVIAHEQETGKKGIAKCSPEDKFDFNIGAKIALERLDKIEVGDKVKIVDIGHAYTTHVKWVEENVDDNRLKIRFAYDDDLGFSKGIKTVSDRTFEVKVLVNNMAYICEHGDYSKCYLIHVDGLGKC